MTNSHYLLNFRLIIYTAPPFRAYTEVELFLESHVSPLSFHTLPSQPTSTHHVGVQWCGLLVNDQVTNYSVPLLKIL